jgi:predicted nuclease of predicted toxin-antitoxin system
MIWVDAHLSPALAVWIAVEFKHPAQAVRDLGFRQAKDKQIFEAAREAGAIILTKDSDFVDLIERFGPPPQVLWVTCGNTSNAALRDNLRQSFPSALALLAKGEPLVEISGLP